MYIRNNGDESVHLVAGTQNSPNQKTTSFLETCRCLSNTVNICKYQLCVPIFENIKWTGNATTFKKVADLCPELSSKPACWPKQCPTIVRISECIVYIWYIWYCTYSIMCILYVLSIYIYVWQCGT